MEAPEVGIHKALCREALTTREATDHGEALTTMNTVQDVPAHKAVAHRVVAITVRQAKTVTKVTKVAARVDTVIATPIVV